MSQRPTRPLRERLLVVIWLLWLALSLFTIAAFAITAFDDSEFGDRSFKGVLAVIGLSAASAAAASMLQYLIIGRWSPLALRRSK